MADQADSKQRPAKQPGNSCKTPRGPHGGGTPYTQQTTFGRDFIAIPPITGHKQKGNLKGK